VSLPLDHRLMAGKLPACTSRNGVQRVRHFQSHPSTVNLLRPPVALWGDLSHKPAAASAQSKRGNHNSNLATSVSERPVRFTENSPTQTCQPHMSAPPAGWCTSRDLLRVGSAPPHFLELSDEVPSLHSVTTSSSTFRAYGISPDSRSASRALRLLTNSSFDIP